MRRHLATAATLAALTIASLAYAQPAHADLGGPHLSSKRTVIGAGATALPKISARTFVVVNATTGEIIAARRAHVRMRPASTLKTLTSVTLMPRLDPAARYTVTSQDLAGVYGSRAGIVAGLTYTIEDLWHALLLPSGNDAAAALAGAYGGKRKTVRAMNNTATRLQAQDTTAVNPSGLDADGQYTSAYDLALFARAALKVPDFVRVSGTTSYALPAPGRQKNGDRNTFQIYGENRLLNEGFHGTIAGKTGYTTLAGRTFWVAAKRGGSTMIVTLMGIREATETAAEKLMKWALANVGTTRPVGTLLDPLPPGTVAQATATPGNTRTPQPQAQGLGTAATTSSSGNWVLMGAVLAVLGLLGFLLRRRLRRGPDGELLWQDSTREHSTGEVPLAAPGVPVLPPAAPPVPQRGGLGVEGVPRPAPDPRPESSGSNVRVVRPPSRRPN